MEKIIALFSTDGSLCTKRTFESPQFMKLFTLARKLRASAATFKTSVEWVLTDRSHQYRTLLHRRGLNKVLFVGITGSAGKTLTKDLVAHILATRGACHSSTRSRNEHLPVRETVLSTKKSHRFSVVEMSASHPGYLDRSIRVVRPDIAVLTVIASDHYSAYRNLDAVAAEKGKIVDTLPSNGIAILNRDDPRVRAIGERRIGRVIWVGKDEGADVRLIEARSIWPDPLTITVEFEGQRHQVVTRLQGVHQATSLLCALGVAVGVGIPIEDAIAALASATSHVGRMQIEALDDGVTFVRDDFKAPQWSLQAPLDFLRDARARRKVVVIGTISDSPNEASRRYAKAARAALEVADLVLLVGSRTLSNERARRIRDDGSLRVFTSVREAALFLKSELLSGDLVLLKGTNATDHLVRIILDRIKPVRCWESSCRKQAFCDECPRAYAIVTSEIAAPDGSILSNGTPAASDTDRMPVVVGLGNPGDSYRDTVHNVGQRVLDRLVKKMGLSWAATRHGWEAEFSIEGSRGVFVKLNQPMNRSGPGLKAYLDEHRHHAGHCMVVLDDADLPLGSARFKRNGGDAGHKGMRSILEALSTDAIHRVRVGVRAHGKQQQAMGFVLSRFEASDETALEAGLDEAERHVLRWIAEEARRDIGLID